VPAYQCAYCGQLTGTTKDHVPPRSLFLRPLPKDLPTVRACASCNAGASEDDEYFRDTVLKWHRIAEKPVVQPLVSSMLRAASMPEKRAYAARAIASISEQDVTTAAGIFLGRQPVYRVQGDRMRRAAERYLRGLYRYTFKQRIPDDVEITVSLDPEHTLSLSETWIEWIRRGSVRVVQEEIFTYGHVSAVDRPDAQVWLMLFYSEFPVLGFLRPPGGPSVDQRGLTRVAADNATGVS
jgi:hypothetical protein